MAGRKHFDHSSPEGSGLSDGGGGEVYFLTVCCQPRSLNQLANKRIWEALVETVRLREERKSLNCRLLLAMPDHFHGLFSFEGEEPMVKVIKDLKSWLARSQGIQWQRDFFDHRLRSFESAREKGDYIRQNPVRAGLVEKASDWGFQFDLIQTG